MDQLQTEQLEFFKTMEQRIRQRYARRTELVSHFIAFIVCIPVMWFVIGKWMPDLPFWDIVGVIVTGGWGMGLLIHIVQTISKEMEDRAVMREMERMGLLLGEEKRKRDEKSGGERLIRLSDDGELIDLMTDDIEEHESHYG